MSRGQSRAGGDPTEGAPPAARKAWLLMSDLVLDQVRRRRVSDELGMSFSRVRALRRIARQPMSMGELASALGIDRPNATVLVNALEDLRLVRRRRHPSDRRRRIVEPTPEGVRLARRAEEILATPPPGLSGLDGGDLETLHRILSDATKGSERC